METVPPKQIDDALADVVVVVVDVVVVVLMANLSLKYFSSN